MSTLAQGRKVAFEGGLLSSDSSDDELQPGQRTPSDASSAPSYHHREYKVYHWRWFMLGSLCLLNISNGTVGAKPLLKAAAPTCDIVSIRCGSPSLPFLTTQPSTITLQCQTWTGSLSSIS